eukprot:184400_1
MATVFICLIYYLPIIIFAQNQCPTYTPDSPHYDVYLFCRIFQLTNVIPYLQNRTFSLETYCEEPWYDNYNLHIDFICDNYTNSMTDIIIEEYFTGGELLTSYPWP